MLTKQKLRIQTDLGQSLRRELPVTPRDASDEQLGEIALAAVKKWLLDQSRADTNTPKLLRSIFSPNLRMAARHAAMNARMAYFLGFVTLLRGSARKGTVRTQIIEYGAVCEAMLIDVLQCAGMKNRPAGKRLLKDKAGEVINWKNGGLLKPCPKTPGRLFHIFDFSWLADKAKRLGVFDKTFQPRLRALREQRNLVHTALPMKERYQNDLDAAKTALQVALDLSDACLQFKAKHRLPLPTP